MAKFAGFNGNYTPSSSNVNYNLLLQGVSSIRATVQEVSWGGAASSSTPMQTRVTRCSSTAATGSSSAATQRLDQTIMTSSNAGNNDILLYSLSSTVLPTVLPGALFGAAWNAYGGVVRWLAAPGEEFDLALTANGIAIVNDLSGPGSSSYGLTWTEF
jgi:hypothetical protein